MIFVMLGTQKQSFIRLIRELEKCNIEEEVIIQIGETKYSSDKFKIFDYVSQEELNNYISKADIIITHGGAGSIFDSLEEKKKIIAVPRLKKYNEHMNDHQLELCNKLSKEGYIECYIEGDLSKLIYEVKNKQYNEYIKDKSYINKLKSIIDNI